LAHGARSVEVLSRLAPTDSLVLAHTYLTEVLLYGSDFEPAREHYQKAIALTESLKMPWLKKRIVEEFGAALEMPEATHGGQRMDPGLAAGS
jgi:hypothetical protein